MTLLNTIAADYGVAIAAALMYIATELVKWYKKGSAQKDNKKVISEVSEILKGQKEFRDEIEDRFNKLELDMKAVKAELSYNSGGSSKDMILELKGIQEAQFYSQLNQIKTPVFLCDKSGECIFSNTALANMFGLHYTEMIGKGWLRAIGETQTERESVYDEWINAVKFDLPFVAQYNVVNQKNGERYVCMSRAEAQRKRDGEVMYYQGSVERIS